MRCLGSSFLVVPPDVGEALNDGGEDGEFSESYRCLFRDFADPELDGGEVGARLEEVYRGGSECSDDLSCCLVLYDFHFAEEGLLGAVLSIPNRGSVRKDGDDACFVNRRKCSWERPRIVLPKHLRPLRTEDARLHMMST